MWFVFWLYLFIYLFKKNTEKVAYSGMYSMVCAITVHKRGLILPV